jgi:hypothetical protein
MDKENKFCTVVVHYPGAPCFQGTQKGRIIRCRLDACVDSDSLIFSLFEEITAKNIWCAPDKTIGRTDKTFFSRLIFCKRPVGSIFPKFPDLSWWLL